MKIITLELLGDFLTKCKELFATRAEVQTQIDTKAPISHASSDTTYGVATTDNYGHVKLSGAIDDTSNVTDGVAATPAAVKNAYDLASTGITNAKAAQDTANALAKKLSLGGQTFTDEITVSIASNGSSDTEVNLFTVPATGLYWINGYARFPANGTGYRLAGISTQIGTNVIAAAPDTTWTRIAIDQTIYLTTGTVVSLLLRQNSGSALDCTYRFKYNYLPL